MAGSVGGSGQAPTAVGTSSALELHPKQMQNPKKKMVKCLRWCSHPGTSKETHTTAVCWVLACAYRTTINATPTFVKSPAVTPTPLTDPAVTTASAKCPAATRALFLGLVSEPENQALSVSVAPICKKKQWM